MGGAVEAGEVGDELAAAGASEYRSYMVGRNLSTHELFMRARLQAVLTLVCTKCRTHSFFRVT